MTTTTPALASGAWLDVFPELALAVVMLAAVVLSAYVVERVKHAHRHPRPARVRKPRPRYRRTGVTAETKGA